MISILLEFTMSSCVNKQVKRLSKRKIHRKDMLRIAHNKCSKYFLDKHIKERRAARREQEAKDAA